MSFIRYISSKIRDVIDNTTKEDVMANTIECPQCHKRYSFLWKRCPFCKSNEGIEEETCQTN